MNAGMQWVDPQVLRKRFAAPILAEAWGDRSDLAGPLCEVVDVQDEGSGPFTILHLPGGSLPVPVTRAMGIHYVDDSMPPSGDNAQ